MKHYNTKSKIETLLYARCLFCKIDTLKGSLFCFRFHKLKRKFVAKIKINSVDFCYLALVFFVDTLYTLDYFLQALLKNH